MSGVLVTVIYVVFMCAFVECQNDTQHVGNKTTADVVVDATTRDTKLEAESNSTLTPTATSTANTEAESSTTLAPTATSAAPTEAESNSTLTPTVTSAANTEAESSTTLAPTATSAAPTTTKMDESVAQNETATSSSAVVQDTTLAQKDEQANQTAEEKSSTISSESTHEATSSEEPTAPSNTTAENAEKTDDDEHAITNDISILQNLNTSHEATTTTTATREEDMLARLGEEDSETTNSTTSHVTRTAHVQTTTEDNCEEDCDEKGELVENAENVTEPSKKEEDECMAYFQELIEKHDLLRRKLKGQLAEHDIDHECHFEARAKRVFHKFYDQTFHLLPAHDAENDNGSHNDHPSLLFKRALTMKLYSQIAHVYLDALRHRNITLSRSLENLILEVVTRTKQALHGHCYDKAYMENCQDIVKKVWHPFIQSIKMESAAKHEHLARFFFERMRRLAKMIHRG